MRQIDVISALRRNIRVILASLIVFVSAGLAFGLVTNPRYTSTSEVFVSAGGGTSTTDLSLGVTFAQAAVKTYAEIATSRTVLLPVARDVSPHLTVRQLERAIKIEVPDQTSLIRIQAEDDSPRVAAVLANSIGQELSRQITTLTSGNFGATSIRAELVDPAVVPTSPTTPNFLINGALGAIFGLLGGALLALLLELRGSRVRSVEEVRSVADLPLLGSIELKSPSRDHLFTESSVADAFRLLRTGLLASGVEKIDRALVVTAPLIRDDKTAVAIGLATALAEEGKRCLLIDVDLQHPVATHSLGMSGDAGLSEYLSGSAGVRDVVHQSVTPALHVVPIGLRPLASFEYLLTAKLTSMIEELSPDFEVVLLDAPPVLSSPAWNVASGTDSVLLIAQLGRLRSREFDLAQLVLQDRATPLLGVIATSTAITLRRRPDVAPSRRYRRASRTT